MANKTWNTITDIATLYGTIETLTGGADATASASTISTMSTADYPVNTTLASATNAFNWAQKYIKPSMFATPDSVLIGFLNAPIKASNDIGTEVPLLGMCESISISMGNSVITLKELRNERNIIIPSKSQPGSITLNRLLGTDANFMRTVGNYNDNKWRLNMQNVDSKQLFGIIIVYLSADRTNTISTVYAERCALQAMSIAATAGQAVLYENVNIIFDKLIDDCSQATTEDVSETDTQGTEKDNIFQSAVKAAKLVNKVKASANALKSVNSIGTLSRAVNYAEDLSSAIDKSGLFKKSGVK